VSDKSVFLPDDAVDLINRSISAVVALGLVDDWEFDTIFGEDLDSFKSRLPIRNPVSYDDFSTGISALGNLLHYPHGQDSKVEAALGVSTEALEAQQEELIRLRESLFGQGA
jgi:hypothetical protein